MNVGERDELIFKIYMTYKRDYGEDLFGENGRNKTQKFRRKTNYRRKDN